MPSALLPILLAFLGACALASTTTTDRTLTLKVEAAKPCGTVPVPTATGAVARDLQALFSPLGGGRAQVASTQLAGCQPSGSNGSPSTTIWSFLVTVRAPKTRSDPAGATVFPVSAQINHDAAAALPATAAVLGGGNVLGASTRAAWRTSHVIRAYPRKGVLGAPVRHVKFQLGPTALPYTATIDTGSPLLAAPCNTPGKIQVCGGRPHPKALNVPAANALSTPAQCSAAGIGCFADGKCWFSQSLTGGRGFNSPAGVFVRDSWALADVEGQGAVPLSVPSGIVACKERYMYAQDRKEEKVVVSCPPPLVDTAGIKSECSGAASSDAGWNFAATARARDGGGKVPSAVSVPQQALDAGLIEEPVLSFCWPAKAQISDCSAAGGDGDDVAVLGPALPRGLSRQDLVEVPLIYEPFNPALAGTSKPATAHFFSAITEAHVPIFGGGGGRKAAKIRPADGSPFKTMHWDTGAGGSQMVPREVLKAYLEYHDAAKPVVKAALEARFGQRRALEFGVSDERAVKSVCGGNCAQTAQGLPERWVMTRFTFAGSGASTKADVEFVRQQLASLFPAHVEAVVEGGRAVVPLPGSFLVNECGGRSGGTKSVVVCSMYRGGDKWWWAVPWFQGRFVHFDVSPAVQSPTQYGLMRYAPIAGASACRF